MALREGEREATGYRPVTKALHWVTLLVLLAQFTVGYTMDVEDDPAEAAREARAERLEERADRAGSERREEALEERADALEEREGTSPAQVVDRLLSGDEPLLTAHVGLGVAVLVLALVRLVRRRIVPLPPWAETLSETERSVAHRTEQCLYLSLVLMPLSGIGLLLVSDDLLPIHVGSHVVFFVALAAHLGLVLKHQLLDRDRLLSRML